jgi:lysine 2,3-aminomutase
MDSETSGIPYGVTQFYKSLAKDLDPEIDPIAAQFVPTDHETVHLDYETADPLADQRFEVTPRVVHHYRDRLLILTHDRCATYCRHCFRRHFTAHGSGTMTESQMQGAAQYLEQHPEVREVLLSGGDPLLMPWQSLMQLIEILRSIRDDLTIRISTRIPVVKPDLMSEVRIHELGTHAPIWIVVQVNHPSEISPQFLAVTNKLVNTGVPILDQTVLLRGVNDSVETLETLFRSLVQARIKPYYLFQGDLASGTRHFRVNIDRGLEIMKTLRKRLSGLAIPTYAVDLPGGGGKVPLTEATVVRREKEWFVLTDADGNEYRYPREHEVDYSDG